ncbi:SpvB/TcaC N-terminal domain-containing protein [Enterobacter chuandaensis]|uniref:SpvB/TcaC N-terminal domain-containing protein n=1 Tax=Enterobacter chuandaensis TaxID=2497875 RepID=UPI001C2E9D1B|nr:SpvB/TcaC N-terminal domain-containing protein [Enterobacter chuandaensis]
MQNSGSLPFTPPSLPSGGGAITGLKSNVSAAGPDGAVTLSIPLPVSAGRGYAPSLSLSYHSRAGNGPFGMGWGVNLPAIRRRTNKGAPAYDDSDEFTGPDGEVLVPALADDGTPLIRSASALLGTPLGHSYSVSEWRARTERDFSRLEFWTRKSSSEKSGDEPEKAEADRFWVMYSPDGQVHLLGRNPQTRISNPAEPYRIAVWLAESSVSATGEQIYWQYRAEDGIACGEDHEQEKRKERGEAQHHDAVAQRYLAAVWYGNKKASRTLPALAATPSLNDWLFVLVADYGERGTSANKKPDWLMPGEGMWPCRADCFSGYEYGFEVRTRRLCHQVLMYHNTAALQGKEKQEAGFELVSRLLLTYNETPSVTTLATAQQCAYEPDGTLCALPPVTFGWQTFTPPGGDTWQRRDDLNSLNPLQPYQLVDLNGEGLAGILYQDAGAWWYRAPEREQHTLHGGAGAVTWGKPAPLPVIPALLESGILADLDGDGWLEWVITAPGVAGRYVRDAEGWRHFTPLSALPVEYTHPRAKLADVLGGGLTDLVLIGPKSVRLYGGTEDGWRSARQTNQSAGVSLPVPGVDARRLVAFSDMAGSGQQHLVEVSTEGVCYWPNLGHGLFGKPVSLPGFSFPADIFNPDNLYLADVDGSGTTDLLYACSDYIQVYRNLSGNGFAEPFSVYLPDGVRYDNTCSLQVADIQGLGVASLVLTVSHPEPRHWVCHLSDSKPWLLNTMNNNRGGCHVLHYRSSAQFWLDEKAEAVGAGKTPPVCHLPFPLHMLNRTEVLDEITGNRLVSSVRYRHGAWDGREREFRGFGMVEVTDTDMQVSQATPGTGDISMPAVTRSWYATGIPAVDELLSADYWQGDEGVYSALTPQFTTGHAGHESLYKPGDDTAYWLHRGLKGLPLRSELYGLDDSQLAKTPYTVTENGLQVRLVKEQSGLQPYPVVWPLVTENRTYLYERVSSDPQCSQEVTLSCDEYGHPLRTVSIRYPRRPRSGKSPYPEVLPDSLYHSSYDDQQQALRLTLVQQSWHALSDRDAGIWLTGLPDTSRQDVFTHPGADVPSGLDAGQLKEKASGWLSEPVFAGQQQARYRDGVNDVVPAGQPPVFPPRVAFTETAVLDHTITGQLSADFTKERLESAGYLRADYAFPTDKEKGWQLWSVQQGHVLYANVDHFYLPVAYQDSLLTGVIKLTRDAHDCVITEVRDAAGLTTTAEYDWRFLMPVRITDANDNVHSATPDAQGRVTSTRFYGTENGGAAGYSDTAFTPPQAADAALALSAPQPVHQCMVYVTDSWQQKDSLRQPPHVLTLTTDRYDSDPAQQIRRQVVFSDGFGRVLQTAVRHEAGPAWQRKNNGSLQTATDGQPDTAETDFRWAVSGRTEYNNKGLPVRTYQPYFLNSWQYVSDDSARQDLHADTHRYDPLGREVQVVTARGWQRRTLFTPWFVVSEDENDTLAETTGSVQDNGTEKDSKRHI